MNHNVLLLVAAIIVVKCNSLEYSGFVGRGRQDDGGIVTDPPITSSTVGQITTPTTPTTPSVIIIDTTLTPATMSSNSTTPIPLVPAGGSIIMNPGDIRKIVIRGRNGRELRYGRVGGGGILTWEFQANNCELDVTCYCVDIRASWNCLNSYLKVQTGILWDNQKYCGGNYPNGFASDSGELVIKYKPPTSGPDISNGITCLLRCTAFNAMPTPLMPVGCPAPA